MVFVDELSDEDFGAALLVTDDGIYNIYGLSSDERWFILKKKKSYSLIFRVFVVTVYHNGFHLKRGFCFVSIISKRQDFELK